jgi:hypothetical protein
MPGRASRILVTQATPAEPVTALPYAWPPAVAGTGTGLGCVDALARIDALACVAGLTGHEPWLAHGPPRTEWLAPQVVAPRALPPSSTPSAIIANTTGTSTAAHTVVPRQAGRLLPSDSAVTSSSALSLANIAYMPARRGSPACRSSSIS